MLLLSFKIFKELFVLLAMGVFSKSIILFQNKKFVLRKEI